MLLLLWPKYADDATGADPVDGHIRKARFGGPSQLTDHIRKKPKRVKVRNSPEDIPTPPASPEPPTAQDFADAIFKMAELAAAIENAESRSALLLLTLKALEAEMLAREQDEMAALFILLN